MDPDARTLTVSAIKVSMHPKWHRVRPVLPSELHSKGNLRKVGGLLPKEIAGDVAAGTILLPAPLDSGHVIVGPRV